MKKTLMKLGAMILALGMFVGTAFAAGSKPYQGALNKFLKSALGDFSSMYVTFPPEGKDVVNDILEMAALMNDTSLDELSDQVGGMLTMMDANVVAEKETALNKDQIASVRKLLDWTLENGEDFKGKTLLPKVAITEAYEVDVQLYSYGAPQWTDGPATLVVYKAGSEWFVVKGSIAQVEAQLAKLN